MLAALALFAGVPGLVAAYLFGSAARGALRLDSDVDVAVLFESAPEPGLAGLHLDLAGALEERLGRPVLTDLRELRFVEHTLQLAIQASLDVASHIVEHTSATSTPSSPPCRRAPPRSD